MNVFTFDLNLLRVFDALMREQHVSRAAEHLSLSQPAVSNALNRLRKLLDDPLLARVGRCNCSTCPSTSAPSTWKSSAWRSANATRRCSG